MQRSLHPAHAVLLAGTVPLFLGVLLSDIAYATTFEVQWKNFASWLLVGGLLFAGLALVWALIEFAQARPRELRNAAYALLLLTIWVLGFGNSLVHAGDAWASIPAAPLLSTIVVVLVLAATALRFYEVRPGAAR